MAKQSNGRCDQLPVLHPHAAGIDVGASELFVAVGADHDPQPVRRFPTFTRDLHALADWLQQCGVRSVAMESTSVYWIPIYQILEARGLEVCLVNAQHVKNVPGRKTDVSDCQWLRYLHSVGLLRGSFRPPGAICAVRALWRHRGSLVQMAAEHIMHIQKALDQMNLQVHRVLTEITGLSGLRILDAILACERDPLTLARLCHKRVKSSESTVAKSLEGDYRPEHIFALRQSQPAPTVVPLGPDLGSKGLGPAYRSLMTFGQADDLVYEFASYSIDAPGRPTQHRVEVCVSRPLMRSLRVGSVRMGDNTTTIRHQPRCGSRGAPLRVSQQQESRQVHWSKFAASAMRLLLILSLLVPSVLIGAPAELRAQASDHDTTPAALEGLSKLADEAHKGGDIEEEIALRRSFSQDAWASYELNPKSSGKFDRWEIVSTNDIPLGLLLEGTRRWSEAESVFRHNRAELEHERLAGNDIKSENQLHLAQVLALEGKGSEAQSICSHWKNRVRHTAAGQDSDHWHGEPRAPLYDTPEVETAAWDLACGSPEQGLRLLSEQIQAHPRMLVSFTVLSHYYFAVGDFPRARQAENDGTAAITGR